MHHRISSPPCALALAVLGACAPDAVNLRPDSIASGQGAVMGRVQVFKGDDEVTGSCYVQLTDEKTEFKANLSLDDSGWVFTAVPTGTTYLAGVSCAVWNGLAYSTGALDFDVPGGGEIAYFGRVRFDLADEDMKAVADAVGAAAMSMPVATVAGALASTGVAATAAVIHHSSPDGKNHVTVRDESDAAEREYHARFRGRPRIVVALAGTPPSDTVGAEPSVVREGNLIFAEAELNGVKLVWLGLLAGDQSKLALRLQRHVPAPALQNCKELQLVLDAESRRLPLSYKVERASMGIQETVQVEADRELLKAITAAKTVDFRACALSRTLSERAREAAAKLLAAYEGSVPANPPVTASAVTKPAAP